MLLISSPETSSWIRSISSMTDIVCRPGFPFVACGTLMVFTRFSVCLSVQRICARSPIVTFCHVPAHFDPLSDKVSHRLPASYRSLQLYFSFFCSISFVLIFYSRLSSLSFSQNPPLQPFPQFPRIFFSILETCTCVISSCFATCTCVRSSK